MKKTRLLIWSLCSIKVNIVTNCGGHRKPMKGMVQGQKTLSWSQKPLASEFIMNFLAKKKSTSPWSHKPGSVIVNHHSCGPCLPQLCEIHGVFRVISRSRLHHGKCQNYGWSISSSHPSVHCQLSHAAWRARLLD